MSLRDATDHASCNVASGAATLEYVQTRDVERILDVQAPVSGPGHQRAAEKLVVFGYQLNELMEPSGVLRLRSRSPTRLWQSWRSSLKKALSSHRKLVSQSSGSWLGLVRRSPLWSRPTHCAPLPPQKRRRASPATTRPRSSSTRPATTPTSPACVSSPWQTTWVRRSGGPDQLRLLSHTGAGAAADKRRSQKLGHSVQCRFFNRLPNFLYCRSQYMSEVCRHAASNSSEL